MKRKDAGRPGMAIDGFALMDCLGSLLVLAFASAACAAAAGSAFRGHTELREARFCLAALADLGELLRITPAAHRRSMVDEWRAALPAGSRRVAVAEVEAGPLFSERWTAQITWNDRLRAITARFAASSVLVP